MTDAELSALEQAARAATPGPWEYDVEQGEYHGVWAGGRYIVPSLHIDADNCKYIAAANPAATLELIAELRQARAERDWLVKSFHMIDCPPHAKDVELCNAQNKCPVCWRLAAKEAVCQK